jgi:hypothetical protein
MGERRDGNKGMKRINERKKGDTGRRYKEITCH